MVGGLPLSHSRKRNTKTAALLALQALLGAATWRYWGGAPGPAPDETVFPPRPARRPDVRRENARLDMVPGDVSASPERRAAEDPVTPVFYNLYTAKKEDVPRVTSIAEEQFALLRPGHKVFVRSIGVPVYLGNVTTVRHDAEGSEMETLGLLWRHCRSHADDKVVYIHSKGSFHDRRGLNGKLRRFLTRGALSKECLELPATCNVCSSRLSPVPHPRAPGNMWLAR